MVGISFRFGLVAVAFAVLFFSFAAQAAPTIQIQIENRFRILNGTNEEQRFHHELEQRLVCGDNKKRKLARYSKFCSDKNFEALKLVNENFSTSWTPVDAKFSANYVQDLRRTISVSTTGLNKPENFICNWSVRVADATIRKVGSCQNVNFGVRLGKDRTADVVVSVSINTKAGVSFASAEKELRIADMVIAALGDSFISGEGNPQRYLRPPAGNNNEGRREEWLDVRCHRSLFTGTALAAERLARNNPALSVTYLPLACSGAELNLGIAAPYIGRETVNQANAVDTGFAGVLDTTYYPKTYLPTQIDVLYQALCPRSAIAGCDDQLTKPDVLVISTGGNEIGFGEVVRALGVGENDVPIDVIKKMNELPKIYFTLSEAIKKFSAKHVLAIAYPDPTQERKNGTYKFCDDPTAKFGEKTFVPRWLKLFGLGATKAGLEEAYNKVLVPLNKAIADASVSYQWTYVALPEEVVRGHGYCDHNRSWFNTYPDSSKIQGFIAEDKDPKTHEKIGDIPSGSMHPNIFGHYNMSERMYAEYGKALPPFSVK